MLAICIFILLILLSIRYQKTEIDFFLCKEQMLFYRGMMITLVLLGHSWCGQNYFFKIFNYYCIPFTCAGYLAVAFFFFLSGYGAAESLKKDKEYLEHYFYKMICKFLIPYEIINIFYIVIYVGKNNKFSFTKILLSFVFPVLNKNSWYIFSLIVFDLFFWFSFKYFSNKKGLIFITILLLIYIFGGYIAGIGNWWIVSSLPFPIGIFFSSYRKKLFNLLFCKMKNCFQAIFCIFFLIIYSIGSIFLDYNSFVFLIFEIITSCWFCIVILIIHRYFIVKNRFWCVIGKSTLFILLCFGLVNLSIKPMLIEVMNEELVSVIVILTSILLGIIINVLYKKLRKIF